MRSFKLFKASGENLQLQVVSFMFYWYIKGDYKCTIDAQTVAALG